MGIIGGEQMKGIDLVKTITDSEEFASIMIDLVNEAPTVKELVLLLEKEITEEQLQTIESIVLEKTKKPMHIEIDMANNRLIVDGKDISKETNYCMLMFKDGIWELEMNVYFYYENLKAALKKATN